MPQDPVPAFESPFSPQTRRRFLSLLGGAAAAGTLGVQELNAAVYGSLARLNAGLGGQESPDGTYWEALKKHYLFQDGLIMMNNGTVGPMPEPVFNTLSDSFRVQCTSPCEVYNTFGTRREEVRSKLARFLGAHSSEIVITRNTTEGMNFIANGLDLSPGDEVILSDMEHPAGLHPWRLKAERHGVVLKEAALGLPPASVDEFVGSFEKAITPRTRVISVSHTVFISGLISPVRELTEMAHRHGVLVLADSAHGPGMLDLDLHAMGVDFLAASPYKWLGAPCGCGILFVRDDVQDQLWPTIASSGWEDRESAQHLETLGQRADPIIFALGEAVDFQTRVGKDRIQRRIQSLATYLKEGLSEIEGVTLHTSMDPYLSGGLTAFSMEGVDPEAVVNYLRERYNLVTRTIGSDARGTRGVRVSTHVFVSTEDVDKVLEGVRTFG
ncbi:MAG: aminotransferase class V-fold PLP-dependent enzyme [Longimicrobiales bacterium]